MGFESLIDEIGDPLEYSRELSSRTDALEYRTSDSLQWFFDLNGHYQVNDDKSVDLGSPDGGATHKRPRLLFIGESLVVGESNMFTDGGAPPFKIGAFPLSDGISYFGDGTGVVIALAAVPGFNIGSIFGVQRSPATINGFQAERPSLLNPLQDPLDIQINTGGVRIFLFLKELGDIFLNRNGAIGGCLDNVKSIHFRDQSISPPIPAQVWEEFSPPNSSGKGGDINLFHKNGELWSQDTAGAEEKLFKHIKGGLLLPSFTTIQRDAIAAPFDGLWVYNSDTGKPNTYSTTWKEVSIV